MKQGFTQTSLTPDNHMLESWNDAELAEGVYTICQPAICPMYDTRSFQLSLMTWAYLAKQGPSRLRDYETFYDYLRVFWKSDVQPKVGKGQDFESFWQETLQKRLCWRVEQRFLGSFI